MSQPFIAEIRIFAGNFNPRGWAFCDGQLLPISQNTALFSLIGTTYGGNGQTTFGLPDLRGRVPMHMGQGPGLSNHVQGEKSGTESVTVLPANLPPHTHAFSATAGMPCFNGPGSSDSPAGGIPAGSATDENYAPAASANGQMAPVSIAGTTAAAGGGQPISVVQPYLVLNFVIALQGIFPSRN